MTKAILTILACVAITGCANMIKGKAAAEAQVSVFHEQFNDKNFDAMAGGAHPEMLKASPKPQVIDLFSAVRRKLGKVIDSQNTNWNVRASNGVTNVVLVQNTTFEDGKGTETFTFRIENEKASLLGYYINSKDLIMK